MQPADPHGPRCCCLAKSNPDPLNLVERDDVVAPVVKAGGAARLVVRHALRNLDIAADEQVLGDARRPEGVVRDRRAKADCEGPAQQHALSVGLAHRAAGQPPRSAGDELEKRGARTLEPGLSEVVLQQVPQRVMDRNFVFLAALLVQPMSVSRSIESSNWRVLSAWSIGVLPRFTECFVAGTELAGLD